MGHGFVRHSERISLSKSELCITGRNYKGIRGERTSVAERAAERHVEAQWSWALCLQAPEQAPWAGIRASPGVLRAGRGRAEHPSFVKFSLCPREFVPEQISLFISWKRGKLGPVRHR